jgi:hypothetical protein
MPMFRPRPAGRRSAPRSAFSYEVENTGNVDLTDVTVTDDQLASAIDCGGGNNVIPTPRPGRAELHRQHHRHRRPVHQHRHRHGHPAAGADAADRHRPEQPLRRAARHRIEKATNGEDADTAPGPFVAGRRR